MVEETDGTTLLEVRDLQMHFTRRSGLIRRLTTTVRAVDGVSFDLHEGETLGLVGESGCGKTSVGRSLIRTYDPTGGRVIYRRSDGTTVDLAELRGKALRPYRRELRMIFQDPFSSLNPRMTVRDIIAEPLRNNLSMSRKEIDEKVVDLLETVGLRADYLDRYPHAFSGGERQRIVIARALSLDPRLVIGDEAVSALDVSVRAQILELLIDLQADKGLTYLFISHDLAVVRYMCDRVAVMYVGKIVEIGETSSVFERPRHPYTRALLDSVPEPDPTRRNLLTQEPLKGEVADPSDPPAGCSFNPRCPFAEEICRREEPELRTLDNGTQAACHFAEELDLGQRGGETSRAGAVHRDGA